MVSVRIFTNRHCTCAALPFRLIHVSNVASPGTLFKAPLQRSRLHVNLVLFNACLQDRRPISVCITGLDWIPRPRAPRGTLVVVWIVVAWARIVRLLNLTAHVMIVDDVRTALFRQISYRTAVQRINADANCSIIEPK